MRLSRNTSDHAKIQKLAHNMLDAGERSLSVVNEHYRLRKRFSFENTHFSREHLLSGRILKISDRIQNSLSQVLPNNLAD